MSTLSWAARWRQVAKHAIQKAGEPGHDVACMENVKFRWLRRCQNHASHQNCPPSQPAETEQHFLVQSSYDHPLTHPTPTQAHLPLAAL